MAVPKRARCLDTSHVASEQLSPQVRQTFVNPNDVPMSSTSKDRGVVGDGVLIFCF